MDWDTYFKEQIIKSNNHTLTNITDFTGNYTFNKVSDFTKNQSGGFWFNKDEIDAKKKYVLKWFDNNLFMF